MNALPPQLELRLVKDISPPRSGFLWLVRRELRVKYESGAESETFVYDAVDRLGRDAVVLLAHCEIDGKRHVFLRSAQRPPLALRMERVSPVAETHAGNLWELPAGLIEENESADMFGVRRAGVRELREELGFDVNPEQLLELGRSVFPAPGVLPERQFFFSIEVNPETRQPPSLDGSPLEEGGVVILMPLSEALEMCRVGEMPDSKSELALRRFAEL